MIRYHDQDSRLRNPRFSELDGGCVGSSKREHITLIPSTATTAQPAHAPRLIPSHDRPL